MRYNFFRDFYEKVIRKIHPLIYIGLAVATLVVIVSILVVRLRPGYDPFAAQSMKGLLSRELIRVGVRDNVGKFSMLENNVYSGFEDDIARRISKELYGEENLVDFFTVDNTTRNIRLGEQDVDCLIALSPSNYSSSFIYSKPYYTDVVAVVVKKGSYASINDFIYGNIAALERPSPKRTPVQDHGALTALRKFATSREKGIIEVSVFSSIENMFECLENGKVQAIAIENAILSQYYNEVTMDVLPEAIGTVPYSIVSNPGNEDFINICNSMIDEMNSNGEMEALLNKWKVVDYANTKLEGSSKP